MFLFGPPNVKKMKARSDVQGLVKALGYEKNPGVILDASKALSEIGLPAVQPLLSVLREKKHRAHAMAMETLQQIGAPAVEPLINALNDQSNLAANSFIEIVLVAIGRPAVEPLIQAFQAGNMNIGQILGHMPGVRARDALIEALEHGGPCNDHGRHSDHNLLIATEQGIPPRDVDNALVRLVAIKSLSAIRDSETIQALMRTVERKSEIGLVRLRAAEVLARYEATGPVLPSLIDLFDDKSLYIRQMVIILLGKTGDPQAREPLTHLLQDKNRLIREKAAEALKRLES